MPHSERAENYVRPYVQPLLGGYEGLTLHDVAKGLGVPYYDVHKKIRRGGKKSFLSACNYLKLQAMPYVFPNETNGLPTEGWVLDTNAAKLFVMTWGNEIGWGYAGFLLQCEETVKILVPELMAKIQSMQAMLDASPGHSRARGPKQALVITQIKKYTNLFGDEVFLVEKKRVPVSSLTPEEQLVAKSNHITTVIKGLSAEQKRIQERQAHLQLVPQPAQTLPAKLEA